jgi:hypothetical protein
MSAEAVDRTLLVDTLARMARVLLDQQEAVSPSSLQRQVEVPVAQASLSGECIPTAIQPRMGATND